MAVEILTGYKPSDFGFDAAVYPAYRVHPLTGQEVQLEGIEFGAYCDKRFAAAAIPTGIGKELIAMSVAKLWAGCGARTMILTATKGLQDQYVKHHEQYGLVDLRGKQNYTCSEFEGKHCHDGQSLGCKWKNAGECGYNAAKARAVQSGIVCSNYDYWFYNAERPGTASGLGRFDVLVLDEGHAADVKLSGFLSMRLSEKEVSKYSEPHTMGEGVDEWATWADENLDDAREDVLYCKEVVKAAGRRVTKVAMEELRKAESMADKLSKISAIGDDWVVEKVEDKRYGRAWHFDVVEPGRYAERYLWRGVGKCVVMSATLRPKTMHLLGVGSGAFEFREWQRIFPPNRNPIYNYPARTADGKEVRVDRRITAEGLAAWVDHIDSIIDLWPDCKGLIETVSYDRQRYLMEHSRHKSIMMGNTNDPESPNAAAIAEEFKAASAPRVLVSPSFSTGWDFPGSQCEYIIICKVPFKPNFSKVAKARESKDKKYGPYQAMIDMVQGAGRGMRSVEDRCVVYVTDGNFAWFLKMNKDLAPKWFVEGVRKVLELLPARPEKLVETCSSKT